MENYKEDLELIIIFVNLEEAVHSGKIEFIHNEKIKVKDITNTKMKVEIENLKKDLKFISFGDTGEKEKINDGKLKA